ncbi:unnamed protein product [Rhodiola kirilowii]
MAGTSKYLSESSSFKNSFEYQVFLSFRGEDVRRTFVDHLYDALKGSGFKVFRDNDGLDHGQDIQSKLYQAIERSQLSIVTFSRRYADSRWCLDELVKIMNCRATLGHTVLPVFYNVEPTHVRHQSGPYKEAFIAHKLRFEMGRVNNWRLALEQVADLKGLSSDDYDGYEAQLVRNIIQEVRKIVDPRILNLPPYIAGTDSIVKEISNWLQDEPRSVSFGVIYGLSGIGKTTIAKIAYNKNLDKFDACSFLADFKGQSEQGSGFAHLLEQLISDLSGKKPNKIYNFDKGMIEVRAIISCRRILLVLDNLDTWIQIHPFLQIPELFHPGSKIIITTTNADIGTSASFDRNFTVHPLKHDESRSLFYQLAFNKDFPSRNFTIISERFIEYCGGHPLALEVLALSLRGSRIEIWEFQVAKLEHFPNKELLDIFKLSFDSLEHDNDKDIFLHVAFFLVGMEKELAIRILESCGLCPKIGLQNLSNRLLVTEDRDGKLMMHQLIRKMGREVVRQEAPTEPGQRSRLWSFKDTHCVLQNNEGTKTIKGLYLDIPVTCSDSSLEDEYTRENSKRNGWMAYLLPTPSSPITANSRSLRTDAFTKMTNLNLLQLNNVQLEGGFRNFPKVIKWLRWNGCPLKSLPMEFDLYELVVLEMCHSRLVHAWGAGQFLGALSVLNLSHSHHLVDTPDFSLALKLEWMNFEDCVSLVKIHESVGDLTKLKYLNFNGCKNLRRLPDGIYKLHTLEVLDLSGCPCVFKVPDPDKSILSSIILKSSLGKIPTTTITTNNSNLSFRVPTSPYCSFNLFTSLRELSLRNCSIARDDIFDYLESCSSLEELDLSGNSFTVINIKVGSLPMLDTLTLEDCLYLQSVSRMPNIKLVSFKNCISLESITHFDGVPIPNYVLVQVHHCPKLVEIKGYLKIEATKDLDADRARYMGYPGLESFGDSKGVYPSEYGLYSVHVRGNHIANWFTMVTSGCELFYTVPLLPDREIRAFNVCCVFEYDSSRDPSVIGALSIQNMSCTWQCFYEARCVFVSNQNSIEDGCEMTWLSHWCVVKHRELRPGDELNLKLSFSQANVLEFGIKSIYEDVEEDFGTDYMETIESCSSSSRIRGMDIDYVTEHENEERRVKDRVADWYNNTFRGVDLSQHCLRTDWYKKTFGGVFPYPHYKGNHPSRYYGCGHNCEF